MFRRNQAALPFIPFQPHNKNVRGLAVVEVEVHLPLIPLLLLLSREAFLLRNLIITAVNLCAIPKPHQLTVCRKDAETVKKHKETRSDYKEGESDPD